MGNLDIDREVNVAVSERSIKPIFHQVFCVVLGADNLIDFVSGTFQKI